MLCDDRFCSAEVASYEFGRGKKPEVVFALKCRKPLPFHAHDKEAFSLDWIAHHHPTPTGVYMADRNSSACPRFLRDTGDILEQVRRLPFESSFHCQKSGTKTMRRLIQAGSSCRWYSSLACSAADMASSI